MPTPTGKLAYCPGIANQGRLRQDPVSGKLRTDSITSPVFAPCARCDAGTTPPKIAVTLTSASLTGSFWCNCLNQYLPETYILDQDEGNPCLYRSGGCSFQSKGTYAERVEAVITFFGNIEVYVYPADESTNDGYARYIGTLPTVPGGDSNCANFDVLCPFDTLSTPAPLCSGHETLQVNAAAYYGSGETVPPCSTCGFFDGSYDPHNQYTPQITVSGWPNLPQGSCNCNSLNGVFVLPPSPFDDCSFGLSGCFDNCGGGIEIEWSIEFRHLYRYDLQQHIVDFIYNTASPQFCGQPQGPEWNPCAAAFTWNVNDSRCQPTLQDLGSLGVGASIGPIGCDGCGVNGGTLSVDIQFLAPSALAMSAPRTMRNVLNRSTLTPPPEIDDDFS